MVISFNKNIELCSICPEDLWPILGDATPVCLYEPATWGPTEADRIVQGEGGWHRPSAGSRGDP